jgi:hypothetical protein
MALRDKLRDRAQPLLRPGDQVRWVFLTQTGMSPLTPLGGLLGVFIRDYWVVVVTDTELVVMVASRWSGARPTQVAYAVPRTILDPRGRVWAKIGLAGRTHYLHRRFFPDVRAQDAEMTSTPDEVLPRD